MSAVQTTVEYRSLEPLGFPGYRVGDDGTIWSCLVKVGLGGGKGTKFIVGTEWKRLKLGKTRAGYRNVQLRRTRRLAHRLVLMAFVGPCPPDMEARHFPDRDRDNNRLSNLSWATRKDNHADKRAHGTHQIGERSNTAKLTESQIIEIRRRFAGGEKHRTIAEAFRISRSTISLIVRRKRWTHI